MCRAYSLLVLGLISLTAGPLAAVEIILKDGRTIESKKPAVIRGSQAVLVLADGKLVSIPASEIDTARTAAAAARAAEMAKIPTAVPTAVRAPSLVDAANATRDGRKASVVLTDQDVAGGVETMVSEAKEESDGQVVIGPVSAKKDATGYAIQGSVLNAGKGAVQGVTVAIEAIGEKNRTIATVFGTLAKDALGPGEKASFAARVDTDVTAETFRYVPRWRVRVPAPAAGDDTARAARTPTPVPGEVPPPPTPAPQPKPEPERTPPPRPADMAAPPANAPVGAPDKPGGSYVPQPSSNQPKPPGGGV
jgi:hypothetical protein